jgi:putative spermidine/putrescine transport system ATP-binding protein
MMAELTLTNVVKYYGAVQAVKGVSFNVRSGELLCILGPSGCGKSTTLRMIGGFEALDGGDIAIEGRSITKLPPNRRPTAMVFQKYTLWPHMRVWENVAFGLKLRRLPRAVIDQKVRDALELVGLPDTARRYPSQLSGGEQQRIALARALVLEPQVLLLDEPLSNLDARLRVRMREEIKRIQRRTGITSIFVTHDQEEALSIADRIAVMSKGVLEQIDTPSEIYANPRTLFAADFIGTMNMLRASGDGWSAGRPLRVAIRPEDLALVDAPAPEVFTGRVDVVMDLGPFRQAEVLVAGDRSIKVFLPKERLLQPDQVLHLRPSRYLLFAGDEPPRVVATPGEGVLAR